MKHIYLKGFAERIVDTAILTALSVFMIVFAVTDPSLVSIIFAVFIIFLTVWNAYTDFTYGIHFNYEKRTVKLKYININNEWTFDQLLNVKAQRSGRKEFSFVFEYKDGSQEEFAISAYFLGIFWPAKLKRISTELDRVVFVPSGVMPTLDQNE